MLAVTCPDVRTRTGLTLVPESHVVRITDDGAGTITLAVACWNGHVHEVVTGRAVTDALRGGEAAPRSPALPEPRRALHAGSAQRGAA